MSVRIGILLGLSSVLFACGEPGEKGETGPQGEAGVDGADGSDGQDGVDGQTSLVSVADEPAGTNCENGGLVVSYGIDSNGNGLLDASEVTGTEYVCDGEHDSYFGDVIFREEQAMAAFCSQYNVVYGSVSIDGSNISSLGGLSCLQKLYGGLYIEDTSLVTLDGLDALTEISGEIYILYNTSLTDISALDAIQSIGGGFFEYNAVGMCSDSTQGFQYLSDMNPSVWQNVDCSEEEAEQYAYHTQNYVGSATVVPGTSYQGTESLSTGVNSTSGTGALQSELIWDVTGVAISAPSDCTDCLFAFDLNLTFDAATSTDPDGIGADMTFSYAMGTGSYGINTLFYGLNGSWSEWLVDGNALTDLAGTDHLQEVSFDGTNFTYTNGLVDFYYYY